MIVVDASVAVRWIADEPDAEAAVALLVRDDLHAPDILAVEVGSALARKSRAKEVAADQAASGLHLVFNRLTLHRPSEDVVLRAHDLSVAHAHPIYDCMYIAVAERLGAELATFDAALRKLTELGGYVPLAPGFRSR